MRVYLFLLLYFIQVVPKTGTWKLIVDLKSFLLELVLKIRDWLKEYQQLTSQYPKTKVIKVFI